MPDPTRHWVDRDAMMGIVGQEIVKAREASRARRPEALAVVLRRIHDRLDQLRVTSELNAPLQAGEMGPGEL